jgi:Protein of unknown function (DUF2934)
MATKSSKPRKTTSNRQKTGQSTSMVTPIGPAGNLRETQNRGTAQAEQRIQTEARVEEEIRIRAYELFEQRGRQEGFHDEDWARAEAEVLARYRRDKSA